MEHTGRSKIDGISGVNIVLQRVEDHLRHGLVHLRIVVYLRLAFIADITLNTVFVEETNELRLLAVMP